MPGLILFFCLVCMSQHTLCVSTPCKCVTTPCKCVSTPCKSVSTPCKCVNTPCKCIFMQMIIQQGVPLVIFKLTLTLHTNNYILRFQSKLTIQYCFFNTNTWCRFVILIVHSMGKPDQERAGSSVQHDKAAVIITRHHTSEMTSYIALFKKHWLNCQCSEYLQEWYKIVYSGYITMLISIQIMHYITDEH